ncbi:hypothetical protein [Maritimibacter fusiformis]|uniref:Uncharacterized protein n=1 Tax=Maritimibacter fusiformis TaxID=2603819 RepID=A0A5D0R9J9_9RHOB|nr:hypothetical protein [Maritimibacter fusiformis]TYB77536.1 hypothetical protein FVF75_14805 [Maritimibacter fusiformis]
MNVTRIEITDPRFDPDAARHQAHVSFDMQSASDAGPVLVHFLCHSPRRADDPASLVTEDLIADALRQARRMPGFRRGERRIVLRLSA